MKISSFYLNDISDDDEFINKLVSSLDESFSEKGFNPLNIGKFIQALRQQFTEHFSEKFGKNIYFKVSLPKTNSEFIDKKILENQSFIQIHLSYDIIHNYMDYGYDITDYIMMIIEQIYSVLSSSQHEFNDYLILQMPNLVDICFNELSVYSKSFIKNNLLKPLSWYKFSKQSSIFNDYYNFYQEDTVKNKTVFAKFLKSLLKRCET